METLSKLPIQRKLLDIMLDMIADLPEGSGAGNPATQHSLSMFIQWFTPKDCLSNKEFSKHLYNQLLDVMILKDIYNVKWFKEIVLRAKVTGEIPLLEDRQNLLVSKGLITEALKTSSTMDELREIMIEILF
jgi:hypothetical protein